MSSENFQTKTENEYLRRTHALTVKVVACAFIALIIISVAFSSVIIYTVHKHAEQIQIIMSTPVESIIEYTTNQDADTVGENSPIRQYNSGRE